MNCLANGHEIIDYNTFEVISELRTENVWLRDKREKSVAEGYLNYCDRAKVNNQESISRFQRAFSDLSFFAACFFWVSRRIMNLVGSLCRKIHATTYANRSQHGRLHDISNFKFCFWSRWQVPTLLSITLPTPNFAFDHGKRSLHQIIQFSPSHSSALVRRCREWTRSSTCRKHHTESKFYRL